MCNQIIITYAEELLVSQVTEAQIASLVEELCNTFTSPFSTLCEAFVEAWIPSIIEWINKDIEYLEIRFNIGLCGPHTKAKKVVRFPGKIQYRGAYNNGFACTMCTSVVSYVESILESEVVEEEIVSLLKQLCSTFSAPYSSLCTMLVDQYLPYIIQQIDECINSANNCLNMGLCDETKANIKRIHKRLPAPSKMAFPSPRIYDHDV